MPPIAQMTVRRRPPGMESVRCACRRCGAHVIATRGFVLAGNCDNCGSYDLVPLPVRRSVETARRRQLSRQASARSTASSSAAAPNGFCSQPTSEAAAAWGSTSAT